jgi:hypothetical protein
MYLTENDIRWGRLGALQRHQERTKRRTRDLQHTFPVVGERNGLSRLHQCAEHELRREVGRSSSNLPPLGWLAA